MATNYTMQLRREAVLAGRNVGATETITASAPGGFDVDVPDGSVDFLIHCAVDVSMVKGFILLSSQNVTVQTNSGSAPDDEIELIAGKVYDYAVNDYNAFLLGTDVVDFLVTNASGETANVVCQFIYDSTQSSPSSSPSASASASPSSSPSASPSTSPSTSASSSPSSSPSAT